jgi:hypothetical protein
MSEALHHIRLLAGLEIQAGESPRRSLDRGDAERLAEHLAADLHRQVAEVQDGLLVLGASLLEPFELLQPGFPAWSALESLAEPTIRQNGFSPGILAIGAHAGRMPHAELQPPGRPAQGQFVTIPMVLICPAEGADAVKQALEDRLFEQGSIDPPARALLAESAGIDSVHGQLLTLADLVALQNVQLDAAGLGGFWPVVEQVLTDPDTAQTHELPGGLGARWLPEAGRIEVEFTSFDQFEGDIDDYALWLRAFRTLATLLDTHAIEWRANPVEPVVFDPDNSTMIDYGGRWEHGDGITAHHHPDIGLLAWTVVEDGRMMHLYPLRAASADRVMRDLAARGLSRYDDSQRVHTDAQGGRLQPATP